MNLESPNILLTELYIDNFKSFKKSKFEFGKINCLIAPNNAGKSNLVEVFEFIDTMLFENITQAVGNVGISIIQNYKYNQDDIVINPKFEIDNIVLIDDYLYKYTINTDIKFSFFIEKGPYPIELSVSGKIKKLKINTSDKKNNFDRLYNDDIKTNLNFYEDYIEKLSKKRYTSLENDFKSKKPIFEIVATNTNDMSTMFKNIFGVDSLFSSYYFHPDIIKNNQKFEEKYFLKDGTNLAYFLKTLDKEVFDNISTSLIGEVDLVESIELLEGSFPIVMFNENSTGLNNKISQHRVSDGTIHFLSLMTALHGSKSNCLIFEEPERHMHMKTLLYILNTMRDSDKQIFFTTHSMEMLQHLKLDEIIFLFRDFDGDTKGQRAEDIPHIKNFMKRYKNDLVELLKLSIVGEYEE
ncbi:MAG: ATP-binding protein [Campylobacterota bacterium]|nr:ATP-binding protein [Campylobacterota bacterium]